MKLKVLKQRVNMLTVKNFDDSLENRDIYILNSKVVSDLAFQPFGLFLSKITDSSD